MPPPPSAADSSRTSKATANDWLELHLPEVTPGQEPLPHREPSFEAQLAHARLLLSWWRQAPEVPKNTERFQMAADFPGSNK